MPQYVEITARSVIRKQRAVESWFISRYGMNLYRGCEHACAYCDGRAEKYRVEGDFGQRIQVKINAPELLSREIPRLKRRGFLFIGGGVCDAYQQAEACYGLARLALQEALAVDRPVHVLTKSVLVRRDLDLLERINRRARALLSVSISTLDPELAAVVEPGCAPPGDRLQLVAEARSRGLGAGIMLMPVLPYLSDADDQLDGLAVAAREAGADYVLMGGTTLKPGRQREHFFGVLGQLEPCLVERYRAIYREDGYGGAVPAVYRDLDRRWQVVLRRHGLAPRIPHRLFRGQLTPNEEAGLVLLHMYDMGHRTGEVGRGVLNAGRHLMTLREDIEDLHAMGMLDAVAQLGPAARAHVQELLETGRCDLYETLLSGPK